MTTRRAKRNPRLALDVQKAVRPRQLPARAQVLKWAQAALENDARITVRIVGQAEARTLNRSFRGKDYATNVLTFDYQHQPEVVADLILCAPVVADEARRQKITLVAHYAHLLVHGALHAQGHDHENDADAALMEGHEREIVMGLGFDDPYPG